MKVIDNLTKIGQMKPAAVCVGNFDGIHLGHQAMLSKMQVKARDLKLLSTVILFEPHALEFFSAQRAPTRILTLQQKLDILAQQGIDQVVVLSFTEDLAKQTAQDFIHKTLLHTLNTQYILTGQDFRFGFKREGDVSLLQACPHLTVEVMPNECINGQRVSSTLLRLALAEGDFVSAEKLLGRKFFMQGEVVKGEQLGRQLGFPTANILPDRNKAPLRGIYAVRVHGLDERAYFGAASIGVRPAVGGQQELLEVHILDFDHDIYGEVLTVEFIKKIRDEENYDTLDALKTQIQKDVNAIDAFFKKVA